MTKPKPTMQYFTIVQFMVTPTTAAELPMPSFHFQQAGSTVRHQELESVSAHVLQACEVLTVTTPTDALKELCTIIHHYDTKNKVEWPNTLMVLEWRLRQLHYKESFIATFVKQLLLTVAPDELLPVQ